MQLHNIVPKVIFVTGLCAASMGGKALQADMVSFSTSIPASDGLTPPTTAAFSLPKFNPALGSLTGIEVDFTLNYQAVVDVYNLSGVAQSFTASTSGPILMDAPSDSSFQLVTAAYSTSGTTGSAEMEYSYPGPVQNATIPFNPLASDYGLYEGSGNNNYTLSYGNGTYNGTAIPGGLVFYGGDANSYGSAKVTYTYAPASVPEPAPRRSTLLLFAMGAVGLAFGALRQRRSE